MISHNRAPQGGPAWSLSLLQRGEEKERWTRTGQLLLCGGFCAGTYEASAFGALQPHGSSARRCFKRSGEDERKKAERNRTHLPSSSAVTNDDKIKFKNGQPKAQQ
ncbi:hypothetical protein DQ04_07491040 [Trypanosoma grayi]|uniref:hypothetical protein n=1 Tax=Trypanosoma grayi TaxID=71804 RepID=UPI0004F45FF7|nr:hypothetical protein DQ04_07491040 [Trypanosoma grayi]KEG08303.1 hypothetical protein DQ04_07491040 [Trypanosoma grayi]